MTQQSALRSLVLPLLVLYATSEIAPHVTRAAEAPGGITPVPLALIKRFQASHPHGGASAGSCSLIAKSSTHAYWITADHVINGPRGVVVLSRPGKKDLQGTVIAQRRSPDLALIRTSSYTVTKSPFPIWPYKLADRDFWAEGFADASFKGFGRRKGRLLSVNNDMARWSLPSIPGESGGVIFCLLGKTKYLCGVTSASDWPRNPRGTLSGFTVGGHSYQIRAFLKSLGMELRSDGYIVVPEQTGLFRRVLGGRRHSDPCPDCLPREQPQLRGGPQIPDLIPEDYVPPEQEAPDPQPQTPTPQPQTPQPQAPQPKPQPERIEKQRLRVEVLGVPGKDGKRGPAGPPGKDGRAPTRDELLALIRETIDSQRLVSEPEVRVIAREIAKQEAEAATLGLHASMQQLQSALLNIQQSIDTIATHPPEETPSTSTKHLVLVASRDASYYDRLTEHYRRASEAFTPIMLTEPDRYTGPLPALVAYQDRIPVQRWLGQLRVEEALHRIARGDAGSIFPR